MDPGLDNQDVILLGQPDGFQVILAFPLKITLVL